MIVFLSTIITIMMTTNEPRTKETNTSFCFLRGLPKRLMAEKNKTVEQSSHVLERSTKTKDYCACTNEYHLTCTHMSRYLKFSEYCPNTSFTCNICHNFKLKRKQSKKEGLPKVLCLQGPVLEGVQTTLKQGSKLTTNWSHMLLDFWLCA